MLNSIVVTRILIFHLTGLQLLYTNFGEEVGQPVCYVCLCRCTLPSCGSSNLISMSVSLPGVAVQGFYRIIP
jgi:hypothetical protein